MELHRQIIYEFISGIFLILIGIFVLRYYKKMIFEWPKKKFLKIRIWPSYWHKLVTKDELEKSFLIRLSFMIPGIAGIIGGIVFIVLSIKLLLEK